MKVSVKVNKEAVKAVEKYVKGRIAKIAERVGVDAYNNILEGGYPYYSGSYVSSWNISAGTKDKSYSDPLFAEDVYPVPQKIIAVNGVKFGVPIYITNYVPHAYKVEFRGTPLHAHEGWFVASHAAYQTVYSYNLKFRA